MEYATGLQILIVVPRWTEACSCVSCMINVPRDALQVCCIGLPPSQILPFGKESCISTLTSAQYSLRCSRHVCLRKSLTWSGFAS